MRFVVRPQNFQACSLTCFQDDYAALLRATNCSSLACLRTVDAPTLRAAAYSICASKFYGSFSFLPVVDGELIQQRPLEALVDGRANVVSTPLC